MRNKAEFLQQLQQLPLQVRGMASPTSDVFKSNLSIFLKDKIWSNTGSTVQSKVEKKPMQFILCRRSDWLSLRLSPGSKSTRSTL